jgi:O-antigen/teichoic acid export membrane protein
MLGMFVVLLGTAAIDYLPPGIDAAGIGFMAILVFSLPLQAAGAEVFRGLKRLGHASIIGLPMYRAIHLALIVAVPLSRTQRTPVVYLGLATLASALSLAVSLAALAMHRRELIWRRPTGTLVREFAIGGLPITATKGADEAAGRLPVWVLASLDQVGAAGVYALAAAMAKGLLLVQSIGWQTLSPFFARTWVESGATPWLERRIRGVASLSTVAAGLMAAVVIGAMWAVLPTLVGQDYAEAAPTALVLAVGTVICIAAGQCGMVLNLTGNQRLAASAAGTGLAAAVVLVPTGAILAQAIGAASGAAAGMVVTNLLQARFAHSTTGMRTTANMSTALGAFRHIRERS